MWLSALLGLVIVFLLVRVVALERGQRRLEARLGALSASSGANEDVELADLMHKLQLHADKLYFAGSAQHWELAGFYAHELGETAEEIAAHDLEEGGVDVGEFVERSLMPRIRALEGVAERADAASFSAVYATLIETCNACHSASGHDFLVIRAPVTPALTGQAYSPTEPLGFRSDPTGAVDVVR